MKLSIITINYNNLDGLRKTFESVFNQTCKDFQYIVIDGGSTDGSVDIIKECAKKIDYWVSEPDKGIYHAMNKGIDKAEGEYCIFMNSGDCFYDPEVVSKSLPHLDGTVVVSGSTLISNGVKSYAPADVTLEYFFQKEIIVHQSTYIRTDWLKKYHYDESYKISSDWKLWIQLLIIEGLPYKSIDTFVSIYDATGVSYMNTPLCIQEDDAILEQLFSYRILDDYKERRRGWENCLYDDIKQSKLHRHMYTFNVLLLRLMSIFKHGKSWASHYPLRLK